MNSIVIPNEARNLALIIENKNKIPLFGGKWEFRYINRKFKI
jgi:hypothetical protein